MKTFALGLATAATMAISLVGGLAEAKSVKWYCVAPDPTTPWIQVCYPSTSRP